MLKDGTCGRFSLACGYNTCGLIYRPKQESPSVSLDAAVQTGHLARWRRSHLLKVIAQKTWTSLKGYGGYEAVAQSLSS